MFLIKYISASSIRLVNKACRIILRSVDTEYKYDDEQQEVKQPSYDYELLSHALPYLHSVFLKQAYDEKQEYCKTEHDVVLIA